MRDCLLGGGGTKRDGQTDTRNTEQDSLQYYIGYALICCTPIQIIYSWLSLVHPWRDGNTDWIVCIILCHSIEMKVMYSSLDSCSC